MQRVAGGPGLLPCALGLLLGLAPRLQLLLALAAGCLRRLRLRLHLLALSLQVDCIELLVVADGKSHVEAPHRAAVSLVGHIAR